MYMKKTRKVPLRIGNDLMNLGKGNYLGLEQQEQTTTPTHTHKHTHLLLQLQRNGCVLPQCYSADYEDGPRTHRKV